MFSNNIQENRILYTTAHYFNQNYTILYNVYCLMFMLMLHEINEV